MCKFLINEDLLQYFLLAILSCSPRVGNLRWWWSLAIVLAGNKAKRLSSVNHTTKTILHHHHHHHHHHHRPLIGQVIIEYILYSIYFLLLPTSFIYIKSFLITKTIKWYICWCWGFFLVFFWSWIHLTLIRSHHFCNRHWSRTAVLGTTATADTFL